MKYIRFILSIFDYFTQRQIHRNIRKIFSNNINTVLDVGAHKGEFALSLDKSFNDIFVVGAQPFLLIEIYKILILAVLSKQILKLRKFI